MPTEPEPLRQLGDGAGGGSIIGTFLNKTMPECTGHKILKKLLGHLQVDQDKVDRDEILALHSLPGAL